MTNRFHAVKDEIADTIIPGWLYRKPLSLPDAHELFGVWAREGIKADQGGNAPLGRLYLRDAGDLYRAIEAAERWVSCANASYDKKERRSAF